MLCQMTINFASEASKTSHDLLKDLQARVSSGQVGNLKVDATHILSMESVPSKFLFLARCGECDILFFSIRCYNICSNVQLKLAGGHKYQCLDIDLYNPIQFVDPYIIKA